MCTDIFGILIAVAFPSFCLLIFEHLIGTVVAKLYALNWKGLDKFMLTDILALDWNNLANLFLY